MLCNLGFQGRGLCGFFFYFDLLERNNVYVFISVFFNFDFVEKGLVMIEVFNVIIVFFF